MVMQLICSKCTRTLDYSGQRPSFCSFCGNPLGESKSNTPSAYDPDAATVAPSTISQSAPAKPTMPDRLGGYRLYRELGAGGMGAVYEAEEIDSGRRVALKLISASFAASSDAVDRFRQEGLIASMLTHPRCVFVIKTDDDAGRPYIIMELMEGSSLKDLVDRQGPLSPDDAIAKTLDVIEGLQAAHRLEIIHRDVKPSNCFLETDGRVKVGDFGLAKSLVKESHLTKTGAFVGTPHFASPEQVRGENIDQQTDVYSVAATLFFLLTGKPPFWGSDPTATLARIVADPVPSLRSVRADLPAALDRVVRRGLERDRSRRYADLEELRQALLGLQPGRLTSAGLAQRAVAFVGDLLLVKVVAVLLSMLVFMILGKVMPGAQIDRLTVLAENDPRALGSFAFVPLAVHGVCFLLYFGLLESIIGCSLAKGVFGLRVSQLKWLEPPPWVVATLRTLVVYLAWGLGDWLADVLFWFQPATSELTVQIISWSWSGLGLAILAATMRSGNHYRGLHELLSRTRVAQVARPAPRQSLSGSGGWLLSFLGGKRLKPGMPHSKTLPESIGGFTVRGALKWTERDKVLLGEDASLGRRVFLWMRPTGAPALDAARRDIGRRTRLRWLATGRQGDWQWDAILAPQGCPLPEFIHSEGTLEWSEARMLLDDLARELRAACADGTLPQTLSPALVWVQADGRAQLADLALTLETEDSQASGGSDEQAALGLLRQVAVLALDGRTLKPQESPMPVRAVLPASSKRCLDRLLSAGASFGTVAEFEAELAKTEVSE